MLLKDFEEILSWQKSQELAYDIYKLFANIKDYWFKDQIQRASVSVSNNIAEWFERKSNNEFKYFLFVAKWSCWEFRSMLTLAKKLNYITDNDFNKLYIKAQEISKLLWWLIKSLK